VTTSTRTERETTATSGPRRLQRAPARRQRHRDDTRVALAFIAPALVGFLLFYIWPLLRGIYLSFTSFNLLTPAQFNGLTNYARMVHDPIFWNALKVTLEYVVINIGLQTVLALVIAVMMQRLTKRTWLRGIMLTPYLVSNVVAAMIFLWILDYQLGIGNNILAWLGVGRIPFLSSSNLVIPTIAFINVWRHVGYRSITIPLLRPILALVLIISIIGSFQVFDTVAITTQGGPVNSSRVLQYYIYDMAFTRFQFGYASTLAVALLVVLVAISFAQYRLTRAGTTDLD
jgi:multiple sugar transport system permease protein